MEADKAITLGFEIRVTLASAGRSRSPLQELYLGVGVDRAAVKVVGLESLASIELDVSGSEFIVITSDSEVELSFGQKMITKGAFVAIPRPTDVSVITIRNPQTTPTVVYSIS